MPVPSGALRFNSDSGKLEYYNGEAWWQIDSFTPDSATGGARGVFAGGQSPSSPGGSSNVIDYITISTTGNAIDFGDTTEARARSALSSSTRGIIAGGVTTAPTRINVIDYITISSTGNSQDFGDLLGVNSVQGAASNSTRGVFSGGSTPTVTNVIQYVTIASTGNAVDFGDSTRAVAGQGGGINSSTRGVFAGGNPDNIIEFITFSTTGNAVDFGDLIQGQTEGPAGASNSTRGLLAGGELQPTGTVINNINYITIATTGNTTDFGDLSSPYRAMSGCSSSIRGVFGGGLNPAATFLNVIEYVTIMTTGNSIDFGDLTQIRAISASVSMSNGHGGL